MSKKNSTTWRFFTHKCSKMGVSSSKQTSSCPNRSRLLQKALQLLALLQSKQTHFFQSDTLFTLNNLVVEAVMQQHYGQVHPQLVVHIQPQNDTPTFTMYLSPVLQKNVLQWYHSATMGANFLCTQLIHSVGHSVLIVCKKRVQGFKVSYHDPYGFPLEQSRLLAQLYHAEDAGTPLQTNRDTELALWSTVSYVTRVPRELWRLYLFYTSHRVLPTYRQALHCSKHVYFKLTKLLPHLQEQGFFNF